ncbi:hypothetical protein [Streptomyces sp. NBC_00525]|uniref:hypothetical protein n=1 Tax=Streptomyces sp. NBC_00525 TaxID=2903660 RepID=UPI002E80E1C0|nr:hypothetical protein [Streptomyces sp. NBC_00525]WUC97343.1 hypothetical protein OG710_28660 [Streptomyces sp. NBC_00525]
MGLMSWLRGGRSAGAPAPTPPDGDGARPDRGDRVDVNRLEPVQRSVTGQRLLIDPTGFEAGLTTRQDTALGTPLGHLVSPEAPAGLVGGVADAVAGSPPPPPVQRAVEMPMPAARAGVRTVVVQRAYADGLPSLTSAGPTGAPAGMPVRRLIGEQPLVPTTEPAGPAPDPVASGPESATPDPGSVASRPEAAAPGPGGHADPPPVQRTAADTPARPLPPPMPPRRAGGLGAPLPGLPPTAQRRAAQSPAPAPSPQVQRDSAPPPADDAPSPESGAPDRGPAEPESVAPLLGDAPLAQRPAPEDVSRTGSGEDTASPADTRTPTAPVQRSATALPPAPEPARPTAPLLGARPLTLRTAPAPGAEAPAAEPAVQRAAESGGSLGGDPSRSSPFVPAPDGPPPAVAVRWTAPDTGGARGAGGATVTPAAPSQPAPTPVQRQTHPASGPGGGPRVPRSVPSAGAVAVAAGVAQRMADGSVVFASAPRDGTSRPVVQRDSETAEEPPPLPEPDPQPEPQPEPEPEPEPSEAAQPPAATTASSMGPEGSPQAPPVTDELVRALYAPLSRLLKADLRLERERSGFLINTRH